MAVSIHLENVVKTFDQTRAIDGVTLTIEAGELFFLLGPSGCGKTTLLRCIAGFHDPNEGRILIGDEEVTHRPPHERDTGMVFQSYALWPHMTIAQNVAFGLEMRKLSRREIAARVEEALALVKMADRAHDKPNQLSGGQQQRIALARALVIHPRCLLLDEPLSNLDAKLRLEMRTEIRRICKQVGLTAIYVTHDQKEALSIADRLAVMNQGIVEQCGTPREVYTQPDSAFVASFIGETNFVNGICAGERNGHMEVQTDLGTFTACPFPGHVFKNGDQVTLSLRPEVLRLGTAPANCPNRLDGQVHDSVYLGEVAQHQVRIGPGAGINFKVFDLNPRLVAREGEAPSPVWVDPVDVVVLPRERMN